MQQSCTYGSGRGALGQPASLPRQLKETRVHVYPPRLWPNSHLEEPEFQIECQIFAKPRPLMASFRAIETGGLDQTLR